MRNLKLKTSREFDFVRKPAGFTLVEMVVVVAIVAVLLSGTLAFLQQSRTRARDVTREQHIKTIQNALALYVTQSIGYPVYDGILTGSDIVSTELVRVDALPQMPKDPLNQGDYRYSYVSADGSTYVVRYYLETGTISGKSAGLNQVSP